jgi:ATP adenylyltransferase
MWSPWRSEYIGEAGSTDGCFLCDAAAQPTEDVLYTGSEVFVILNAFPYNTGHLMIAPVRHVGEVDGMSREERNEMFDVTASCLPILREAMSCEGFNIGMNLGVAAGAGVPGHAHMHVVPRWSGDTNFMPALADTKVLPEMLRQTREKLSPGFALLASR